jgi:ATP-binding cassette subfamily B protein
MASGATPSTASNDGEWPPELTPEGAGPPLSRASAWRAARMAAPFAPAIGLVLVLVVAQEVAMVLPPLLLKQLVDEGVLQADAGRVTTLALAVAGLELFSALAGFGVAWASARVGEGLVHRLRVRMFEHVQRMPVAFFTRAQTGALVSRISGDVRGAEQAVTAVLPGIVSDLVGLALVASAMLYLSWPATVGALLLFPLFLYLARHVARRLRHLTRQWTQRSAAMSALLTERLNLPGALLVKLFARPGDEGARFARQSARLRDVGVGMGVVGQAFSGSLTLMAGLATVCVYLVGGHLAVGGRLSVGTLIALTALLGRLSSPIARLSSVRVGITAVQVSFERILELLDLRPMIREQPGAVALPNGAATVEFDRVCFRHPAASEVAPASLRLAESDPGEHVLWTLRDVSFRIAPGRRVALIGPSGAGKTTIGHLLARLHDPTEGAVRIGPYDLRDVTMDSLSATVGVISQDAHLFHASVRENLLLARPDATTEELVRACRAAHVWAVVAGLPDGLDTVVGDHGHRLSGGERQRLAIARLLLKAPSIVVLDEATAHLDAESERAVQQALDGALEGRTCLVIAHRLSTIRGCDEILVVEGGRIVERGGHDELLDARGAYARAYRAQSSGARARSA